MLLHNIRRGFATNSSSTHSIIILPKDAKAPKDNDANEGDFGWQFFTAASPEKKMEYAFVTLANNLNGAGEAMQWLDSRDDPFWQNTFKNILSSTVSEALERYGSGYIDHQSAVSLPWSFGQDWKAYQGIDGAFFKAWVKFLMNPRTVILGGNDNDDRDHPLTHAGEHIRYRDILPVDGPVDGKLKCRKESVNGKDWFTLFHTDSGDKYRVSFPTIEGADIVRTIKNKELVKAQTPELVDIKITDYCPIGCEYCYQGSTKDGAHAYVPNIKEIASALGRMKVFEVAIGGGEPTMHPHFTEILGIFRSNGIVPNFTSRSLHWLKSKDFQKILDTMGAVAFSVNNGDDVKKTLAALAEAGITKEHYNVNRRIHFQYVVGTGSDEDLKSVFAAAAANYHQVTLLGYKMNGRGKSFLNQANPAQDWVKIAKEAEFFRLGIDTALAHQYEKQLKQLEIPENTYHLHEGKFSMYVDAVALTMAPSSYCDEKEYVRIPEATDRFTKEWAERSVKEGYGDGVKYQYTGQTLLKEPLEAIQKSFSAW